MLRIGFLNLLDLFLLGAFRLFSLGLRHEGFNDQDLITAVVENRLVAHRFLCHQIYFLPILSQCFHDHREITVTGNENIPVDHRGVDDDGLKRLKADDQISPVLVIGGDRRGVADGEVILGKLFFQFLDGL